MSRQLFDIWEDPIGSGEWNAQMINFVGHFKSEAQAQRYVTAVKAERKKLGLK